MKENATNLRPILSCYLTRLEWKLVVAYGWAALHLPAYGLAGLPEEERVERCGSLGKNMLWSINQLALRHGMKFQAVGVEDDGKVYLKVRDPIEEGNLRYVERLARGKGPNMVALFKDAVTYARACELDLDLEPMFECWRMIEDDVARVKAETDPEWEEVAVQTLEEGMFAAGYVKGRDRRGGGDDN